MMPTSSSHWPPRSSSAPLAVLVSGGLDSAVLLGEAVRAYAAVYPLYIRTGLFWEAAEQRHLDRFLARIGTPSLQQLKVLDQPVADLYGEHWSMTGTGVPAAGTPDEDVFLPGRNVLLLAKSLLWCHLNRIPLLAMAPLAANPFPDATPEFFSEYTSAVNRAVKGSVEVIRPYAHLNKVDVLHRGRNMPLEDTLSCNRPDAGGNHCGRCNKCHERQQAFLEAEIRDPTVYT
jgi:7-cyano-7-deazaguanine synthase